MENVEEFIAIIENDICSLNVFKLSCIFKDTCLRNFIYSPRVNSSVRLTFQWDHIFNRSTTIRLDTIRKMLCYDVLNLVSGLQSKYLSESQIYTPIREDREKIKSKIKKCAEICIAIETGLLLKEFIDNYRYGYFD